MFEPRLIARQSSYGNEITHHQVVSTKRMREPYLVYNGTSLNNQICCAAIEAICVCRRWFAIAPSIWLVALS